MPPGPLCTQFQRVTAALSRGRWRRSPKCEEPKASQSTASGKEHCDAGEESVEWPGTHWSPVRWTLPGQIFVLRGSCAVLSSLMILSQARYLPHIPSGPLFIPSPCSVAQELGFISTPGPLASGWLQSVGDTSRRSMEGRNAVSLVFCLAAALTAALTGAWFALPEPACWSLLTPHTSSRKCYQSPFLRAQSRVTG